MADVTIEIPVLRFYKEFPDEWEEFPTVARVELGDFFEVLQQNPLSPELLERCETEGEYYAHHLSAGYSVVWKLEFHFSETLTISVRPKRIWILAIVPERTQAVVGF